MKTDQKNRFALTDRLRRSGTAFRSDEDGGIIIFSLFIMVLMLMVAGMAVDLMRFETTRTKLQGTLDRAVLAAADLDQTLPPKDVVRDYFRKAGMLSFLQGDPTVQEGLNYRVVHADAEARVPMLFMKLMGINTLQAPATGTAEERITDIEISLVLDMSSSMQQNNKLVNLRTAARDFITTVMKNNLSGEGLTTVSLVPYSAVVNMGPDLATYFPLTAHHTKSYCALFGDAEFNTTAISRTITRTRVSDFDYGAETNTSVAPITRPWCFRPTENPIIVHSTNETGLKNAVTNLVSFGNTAIDVGMKWGAGLLDPAAQSVVTGLIAQGKVPATAVGRPLSYTEPDNAKIIVLMTDGENTQEYDLAEPYKSALSTVWVNYKTSTQTLSSSDFSTNQLSVQYAGLGTLTRNDDMFFWLGQTSTNRFMTYPQGFPSGQSGYRSLGAEVNSAGQGIKYGSTVAHLSWQDIYSTWVRTVIYNKIFNEPYSRGAIDYNTYVATYYGLEEVVGDTAANTRLANICAAAKNNGVIIYTVAFEAPSGGKNALLNCASSPAHYFDVAGTNISTAFAAIASDIAKLRLTQ